MRRHYCTVVVRYNRSGLSFIKSIIYIKNKKFRRAFFLFFFKSLLLILYFLHIHWFYFLGSNNRKQKNDEENPETHQLLSHIDKENDRDGVYIFERNIQDKNNPLKLERVFFFIFEQ